MGPGCSFGEVALVTRQPRFSDARAVGYCHLLELDARDFHRLVEHDRELKHHIEASAEARRLMIEKSR
ncbi:hypothetical protein CCP2SC5_270002 [Azospirillaceae bacterium]